MKCEHVANFMRIKVVLLRLLYHGDQIPKKSNLKEERFIWFMVSHISVHFCEERGSRAEQLTS
jgi:hypothetical protein